MKERGHAEREGPAGTRAQLCLNFNKRKQDTLLRFPLRVGNSLFTLLLFRSFAVVSLLKRATQSNRSLVSLFKRERLEQNELIALSLLEHKSG